MKRRSRRLLLNLAFLAVLITPPATIAANSPGGFTVRRGPHRALLPKHSQQSQPAAGLSARDAQGRRSAQSSHGLSLCGVVHPVGGGRRRLRRSQGPVVQRASMQCACSAESRVPSAIPTSTPTSLTPSPCATGSTRANPDTTTSSLPSASTRRRPTAPPTRSWPRPPPAPLPSTRSIRS